jgi:importin subunit alpha-1
MESTQKQVKRDFKKGISLENNRRRREESQIKLRKESKVESIAKRRYCATPSDVSSEQVQVETSEKLINSEETVKTLYKGLLSPNTSEQTNSLRGFRRLLSLEKGAPVDLCIELGIVPILVTFLEKNENMEQQFEAAWGKLSFFFPLFPFLSPFSSSLGLTNIASTDKTRYVVDCQAVPRLISLLTSPNADIREQVAWCLGNIAGDGVDLRDMILAHNALQPLLINITQFASPSLLRNCTWTLSNFCRGKPQAPYNIIAPALPILGQLITSEYDQEAMTDATWALSYLSDGDDTRIQAIVDLPGIIPSLIKMISSNIPTLIIPALRTLGNIVSGNDKQTQSVLNESSSLPALTALLSHAKKSIRKETCWVLSNIAAGTQSQLTSLFSVKDLLPSVLRQLSTSVEWDVRKEASWVICNTITSCEKHRLFHLIELGTISHLCDLLSVGDPKIILLALDSLETFLKAAEGTTNVNVIELIDEANGLDSLEKLQEHQNTKVYERAIAILGKK